MTHLSGDLSSASEHTPPFSGEGKEVSLGGYKDEGWSWGGFGLNLVFLFALRKYKFLAILILALLFSGNFLFFMIQSSYGMLIALSPIVLVQFFLGVIGRKFARESNIFSNHEQYLGFMKGVDHAGKAYVLMFFSTLFISFSVMYIPYILF